MDPGLVAAQALRSNSSKTGKLRKISYVNNAIGLEKTDTPKKGQPILCNEMRDHISILPSKLNNGRAFVRGMEYLLPNTPDGANIRPQRVVLSIAENSKSSWDRDKTIHLPQAATLCNIGDDYVKPEVRTRVPRPVSVRVLSRYTLGTEKQLRTQRKDECSLINSFLAQKSMTSQGANSRTADGSSKSLYRRSQSNHRPLFHGSATFHLTDGGTLGALESQNSQVYDDSIDLTIYRDPCSIAREVAYTKNTQAVTHTDEETAGELQRLHDSCVRTSISSSNPSSNAETQREYRRPPVVSFCAPCIKSTIHQKKESQPGPIQSIPNAEHINVELSHSPPPVFTKPTTSAITPLGPSNISTRDGGSGLQASALIQASTSTQRHNTSNKPPRTQPDHITIPVSYLEDHEHNTMDNSHYDMQHHTSQTPSTVVESSVHSYGQGSCLNDQSSTLSDMAPESLLPGAPVDISNIRAKTAVEHTSSGVFQLQYRELDNLEASFNKNINSFSCIQNTPECEPDPNSLTAPGVALPSMRPIDQSPSFPITPNPPQSFKARSYSAQASVVVQKRRFNIINDSAVLEQHIIHPSSRKQVTKAQNVVLGPSQRRGASASGNRWKVNIH